MRWRKWWYEDRMTYDVPIALGFALALAGAYLLFTLQRPRQDTLRG